MSLKDKIMSAFLVEEEEAKPESNNTTASSVAVTQPTQSVPVAGTGEVNQKMVDELSTVLEERNLQGPDYLEMRNAANALKEVLNDDNQALKTAFITIKATHPNFTKEIVFNSLDTYLKIIEDERLQGKKALEAKRNKEVHERETFITDMDASNDKCQKEIETLENQINTLRARIVKNKESIAAVRSEINQAEAVIRKQELDFNASVDFMMSRLTADKQNLTKLL
ncbi:hypothetical protein FACS189437_06420 [Bacteroidia bacterium]|nr:hypothetical protein FACS189437_06420 [Bacteroidia bacterium]